MRIFIYTLHMKFIFIRVMSLQTLDIDGIRLAQ